MHNLVISRCQLVLLSHLISLHWLTQGSLRSKHWACQWLCSMGWHSQAAQGDSLYQLTVGVMGTQESIKVRCTPTFTAALFPKVNIWKQRKCSLTDEWMKVRCLYTMKCYSVINMNEIMPLAATWMNLEIIILSEVSQTKTNTSWYHLYVETKIWWTFYETDS